jgi:hypothetical protein
MSNAGNTHLLNRIILLPMVGSWGETATGRAKDQAMNSGGITEGPIKQD